MGNAPEVLKKLKSQTVTKGSKVELVCEVELGSPTADVTWERQGRPVKPSNRIQQVQDGPVTMLTIDNCTADDIGQYTMRASNKLGTVETEATLSVTSMCAISYPYR